jgi:hypothetical protein
VSLAVVLILGCSAVVIYGEGPEYNYTSPYVFVAEGYYYKGDSSEGAPKKGDFASLKTSSDYYPISLVFKKAGERLKQIIRQTIHI